VLRVAIVGCGKHADAHASQIQRIPGARIVGVCDREPLMARQLFDRFPVDQYFSDLDALVREVRPDVVHITTPAATHYDIARQCLDHGCHVYVEKPFTLYASEARDLVELALRKDLRLTVGHDVQFSHASRRMRKLVESGYLGGAPVHIEGHYCYDIGDTAYASALLTDKSHWVRRLPGKLLQNIISHGIAAIAEFLPGDAPTVITHAFVSPKLSAIGETELIDELRLIIAAENGATAYFTFSTQMRPLLHQLRVYGPKNGLAIDWDQDTLIRLRGSRFKLYAEKFVPLALYSRQYFSNLTANLHAFCRNDFHFKSGMKELIASFYRSIEQGGPEPIPYREILLTSTVMDAIFNEIADNSVGLPKVANTLVEP
jgi:predicted dehydrogenase